MSRVSLSNGYVVIFGGSSDDRPQWFDRRIYWNVTADGAPALLATLTKVCRNAGAPFLLKAICEPSGYERCDSVVLLVPKECYGRAAPELAEAALRHVDRLGAVVPALTKPLRPGVGWAASPRGAESFGEHRCRLLASALLEAADRRRTRPAGRLESIRARFAQAGLSLERPYSSTGEEDPPAWGVARRRGRAPRRPPTARGRARTRARLLEAAGAFAREIEERALFVDGDTTWLAESWPPSPGSSPADKPALAPLGHDLYGGVAGVGLTLAMVAARTREARSARTARGALAHALTLVCHEPTEFADGFHLGWAGTVWAAAIGGMLLRDRRLVERSRRIARARAGDPAAPGEYDLLSGAAGTMLGLALLAEVCSDSSLLAPARALAETLAQGADRKGRAASWSITGVPVDANLTGLSHGAAGIAHALLELHRMTGDSTHRRLAAEAIRYERGCFDRTERNWPDFRHSEEGASTRRTSRRFMVAWCHGAAGIGLARLHAATLLDDPASLAEAREAVATVRGDLAARLGGSAPDLSLCHGLLGPLVTLAAGAERGLVSQAKIDPMFEVAADHLVMEAGGISRIRTRRRPGLFLGRAGMIFAAYALAGEPTPPVLLPTALKGLGGRSSP
jgi:hypothetical protein